MSLMDGLGRAPLKYFDNRVVGRTHDISRFVCDQMFGPQYFEVLRYRGQELLIHVRLWFVRDNHKTAHREILQYRLTPKP